MDGSFGPRRETVLGFQPETTRDRAVEVSPELDPRPVAVAEPEWSLSAWQVALIVLGIVGFCEVIGTFF